MGSGDERAGSDALIATGVTALDWATFGAAAASAFEALAAVPTQINNSVAEPPISGTVRDRLRHLQGGRLRRSWTARRASIFLGLLDGGCWRRVENVRPRLRARQVLSPSSHRCSHSGPHRAAFAITRRHVVCTSQHQSEQASTTTAAAGTVTPLQHVG